MKPAFRKTSFLFSLFIDIFADVKLQVQHSEVDQMFTGNVSSFKCSPARTISLCFSLSNMNVLLGMVLLAPPNHLDSDSVKSRGILTNFAFTHPEHKLGINRL